MVYSSPSHTLSAFSSMERNFGLKEEFVAGGSGVMAPPMSVEDAYISGFLPDLSFQSVLQPLSLTLVNYPPFDGGASLHSPSQMPAVASSAPVRFRHGEVLDQKLKVTKQERLNIKDFAFQLLKLNGGAANEAAFTEPLVNFFTSSPLTNPSLGMIDGTEFFSYLPPQKSYEPLLQPQTGYENKQDFHFHPTDSSSSSFSKNQINSASMTVKRSAPYGKRAEGVAKRRRQRVSDKIRGLEKLLPWNRRMDTATMLEEAYKYVKFLQAQIRVLQAMPIHSSGSCCSSIAYEKPNLNEFVGGVLARLNRQQLLEVVMNSPGAQTVLYSRGSCVYSMEQLLLLKKMAEKAAMEQMFFPSSQF